MISYPSSNTSYFSVLFQEKFFKIPASEILTSDFLQQKMQMIMNALCPPGGKLGQLADILQGEWEGKGSFSLLMHMQSLRIHITYGQNSEQRNAGVGKKSSSYLFSTFL